MARKKQLKIKGRYNTLRHQTSYGFITHIICGTDGHVKRRSGVRGSLVNLKSLGNLENQHHL